MMQPQCVCNLAISDGAVLIVCHDGAKPEISARHMRRPV